MSSGWKSSAGRPMADQPPLSSSASSVGTTVAVVAPTPGEPAQRSPDPMLEETISTPSPTPARRRRPSGINLDQPDRDMTIYKITGVELVGLGVSSGVASALLGGSIYFFKQLRDLPASADATLLSQTQSLIFFLGAL